MKPLLNNLTKTLRSLFLDKINNITYKKESLNFKNIFNKTHENNLISQLTSSQNLELAFCEYCKNNLILLISKNMILRFCSSIQTITTRGYSLLLTVTGAPLLGRQLIGDVHATK